MILVDEIDMEGFRGETDSVGTKLKSVERDFLGDNTTGFGALPSGCRDATGAFNRFDIDIFFWSATEVQDNFNRGYRRVLRNSSSGINRSQAAKSGGYYVRCVKDVPVTSVELIKPLDTNIIKRVEFYSITGAYVGDNLKTLPQGIYIKRILYNNGKIESKKIFKQKYQEF